MFFQQEPVNIPGLLAILDADIFNNLPEGPADIPKLLPLDEVEAKQKKAAERHREAVQLGQTDATGIDDKDDSSDETVPLQESLVEQDASEAQQPNHNNVYRSETQRSDSPNFEAAFADDETDVPTPTYQMVNKVRSYFCSKCHFTRTSKPAVQAHIFKEHCKQDKLKCSTCPYETWNPSCFTQHVKRCEKRRQCQFCSYSSTKVSDLKRHCARWHKHD